MDEALSNDELLENAEPRANDRVVIYHSKTGRPYERARDCAADMLRTGDFTVEKPPVGWTAPAEKPFSFVPLAELTADPAEAERQAQFKELVEGGITESEARALVWPPA